MALYSLNEIQDRIDSIGVSRQNRYVRILVLDANLLPVEYLEGQCIGGSITVDANSDIRRTGNIEFVLDKTDMDVNVGSKYWLDKYIKIFVGHSADPRGYVVQVDWVNCGVYMVDAPAYHYDASTNTVNFSLLDMMAKMTGTRNGYLKGIPVKISAGERIKTAMTQILEGAGFTNYYISNPPEPGLVPFDLDFGQGATVYELLKALCDLYPGYEMFFDVEGNFVYQKIPTSGKEDAIAAEGLWNKIVISEDIDVDFQNVKNVIEVYGRSHDPARFSNDTTIIGNKIHLGIPDVYRYLDGVIYGFTVSAHPNAYENMELEINKLGLVPITLSDGATPAKIPSEETEAYCCVQYNSANADGAPYFIWLGHIQPYGYAEDNNPKSPFFVKGSVGRIRLPLFGGQYDNIYSDELAQQRAEYELYLHTNMNSTVKLTCIPVYWLDVNKKVQYTLRREMDKENPEREIYITKNISYGFAPTDTMSVTLVKFYPDFEI